MSLTRALGMSGELGVAPGAVAGGGVTGGHGPQTPLQASCLEAKGTQNTYKTDSGDKRTRRLLLRLMIQSV